MPTPLPRRRIARRPQLERDTPLVPLVAARGVIEETSLWLGVMLPPRYAAALAFRARRCYAHSPLFREKICRPGDGGRETLWRFLRHWLADRLLREAPDLYRRLPTEYALGAELPHRNSGTVGGALCPGPSYLSREPARSHNITSDQPMSAAAHQLVAGF